MSKLNHKIDSESNERRQVDRRRRRVSLAWPERRSGFDRRGPVSAGRATMVFESVLVGLRERPAAMRILLVAINMLNVADFALTMNALSIGGGEANPIMRSLFDLNPVYAGLFKIFAILAVSVVIWRFRQFRSALQITLVLLAIFLGVFFYHILGLIAFC